MVVRWAGRISLSASLEFHWRRSCQQVPSALKCSTGYSEEARDDSKNKGTGEAVSDPEEDKQAANPPHHDR